jgi:hypothetical protein
MLACSSSGIPIPVSSTRDAPYPLGIEHAMHDRRETNRADEEDRQQRHAARQHAGTLELERGPVLTRLVTPCCPRLHQEIFGAYRAELEGFDTPSP